jgi:hypothetical protein
LPPDKGNDAAYEKIFRDMLIEYLRIIDYQKFNGAGAAGIIQVPILKG